MISPAKLLITKLELPFFSVALQRLGQIGHTCEVSATGYVPFGHYFTENTEPLSTTLTTWVCIAIGGSKERKVLKVQRSEGWDSVLGTVHAWYVGEAERPVSKQLFGLSV